MNNILIKALIFILIISGTSCSYKPIFLEKDYDFEIKKIFTDGDKDINRIIKNKLEFIKKSENKQKRNYIVKIIYRLVHYQMETVNVEENYIYVTRNY